MCRSVFLLCSTTIDLACNVCLPGEGTTPTRASNEYRRMRHCLQSLQPLFAGLHTLGLCYGKNSNLQLALKICFGTTLQDVNGLDGVHCLAKIDGSFGDNLQVLSCLVWTNNCASG